MKTISQPVEGRYVLVAQEVLPEVFGKVLEAKELLASGTVRSISTAVRQVGLSRSAFYKYKDCVFLAEDLRHLITLQAVLVNEPGTLQSLLAGLSAAGADVVTIHQQKPKGDLAQVTLTVDTAAMHTEMSVLLQELRTRSFVRSLEQIEE